MTDLPPHSPESEQAFLGAIILENSVMTKADFVAEEMFFEIQNREVYSGMLKLKQEQKPIDTLTLRVALSGKVEPAYIAQLPEACPHPENWEVYARSVWWPYQQRKMISFLATTQESVRNGELDVDYIQSKLSQIIPATKSKSVISISEMIPQTMEILEKEISGESASGILSGYPDLDYYTGGFQNGELVILAARPSLGKTSLAMNIVERIAFDDKIPCGVFSLEMNRHMISRRMISSMSRVNLQKIRNRQLMEDELERIKSTVIYMMKGSLFIDDTPGIDIRTLRKSARSMVNECGVKFIVVDYLQLMRNETDRGENREREVAQISNGLKALASELNIPILVLAQLNRMIENGKGRRPRLSDLRESGAIEQDADTVLFLYRNESDQEEDAEAIKVLIGKQRNGPRDVEVTLTFLKKFTRFESSARVA